MLLPNIYLVISFLSSGQTCWILLTSACCLQSLTICMLKSTCSQHRSGDIWLIKDGPDGKKTTNWKHIIPRIKVHSNQSSICVNAQEKIQISVIKDHSSCCKVCIVYMYSVPVQVARGNYQITQIMTSLPLPVPALIDLFVLK